MRFIKFTNTHALRFSTAADRNSIAISPANFYGHEFFKTVSNTCFRVTFIFGSENHESHNNFSFIFFIHIELLLGLLKIAFLKFSKKLQKPNSVMWSIFCYAAGFRS